MRRACLAVIVSFVFAPRAAWPQGGIPQGPEFRVNSYTTNVQDRPAAVADPAGNFVVIWDGQGQGDSNLGIFGQRYAGSGTPLGSEFRVNTATTNFESSASVAADSSGNFVVVWSSSGGYGGTPPDVFGQRFASDGTPLGLEFRINSFTTGGQFNPAVAAASAGGFVVVWTGDGQGDSSGIFGQRYASSGLPLGPEFRVNTSTTDFQYLPSVAADSTGNFVVAWTSGGGYGGAPSDVFGQRYASSGTPLGPEFLVNTYTTNTQGNPAVADGSAGGFVVLWSGEGQGDTFGIFGQRYASSGAPAGPEFRANSSTTDFQFAPSVAADAAGSFVVAWTVSGGYGGVPADVVGQRYASDGTPLGADFRINTYTTSGQSSAAVAADPVTGNFVVTWVSIGQDGSNTGIFGQRYGRIVPVELTGFSLE